MKKIFFYVALVLSFINVEAQTDYSGNYGFQSMVFYDKDSEMKPDKEEVLQGRMGDLTLIKIDSVKYKFWLSANRGWPSYNQGNIDGIIIVKNGKAAFKIKQDYTDSSCLILFSLYRNYIEVDQRSSDNDCGFGHNVYADGKYNKRKFVKLKNKDLENLYMDFTSYQIVSNKTFLFEDELGNKRKTQYFIKNDIVLAFVEKVSLVYVEYITASGKFIYGWLKKSDLKQIK